MRNLYFDKEGVSYNHCVDEAAKYYTNFVKTKLLSKIKWSLHQNYGLLIEFSQGKKIYKKSKAARVVF